MTPRPTDEQLVALDLFSTGTDLAIEAGAGTGKTTTLLLIGNSTPRRGQYIAFNRAIVAEAQRKVPDSVGCSTAHSLAMRAVGYKYRARLGAQRERSETVADQLGLRGLTITALGNRKFLRPGYLAGLVMRSIGVFCNSADLEPGIQHVPYIEGIDPLDQGQRTYANNKLVRHHIEKALRKAWTDITAVDGTLRFSHDHYLKMWQLDDPKIPADYILFDEAQDASPVMLDIVARQRHAQRVYVGDTCQPPGTMVTVVRDAGAGRRASIYEQVPIQWVKMGDRVVAYDMAKRHMHARGKYVTRVGKRSYDGELIRVTLPSGHSSRYTLDHHVVTRIGSALSGKHVVYLMRRGEQYRIGRCQWRYGSQGNLSGPYLRTRQEHGNAFWVLSAHDTAREAALEEALTAQRFNIPTLTFEPSATHLIDVRLFWEKIGDNRTEAGTCLRSFGRLIDKPLWALGMGNLLQRRPIVTWAANLMDGFQVLPWDPDAPATLSAESWIAARVTVEPYVGQVYNIEVVDDHTYVADKIVTHNCQQIYEWRGAINALASLEQAQRAFLSQSFRFGQPIADAANMILAVLDAELRLVGKAPHESRLGPLVYPENPPDAYLYRTNAAAFGKVLDLLSRGQKPFLVGGGAELLAFARGVEELQGRGYTTHPELACFSSWREVLAYVADDEQGSELKLLVDLVVRFGTSTIRRVFETMVDEAKADVVISTAHKAKGREWDNVRLGDDFPDVSDSDSDWRLLYVACTRARKVLDYFDCDPVAFLLPPPERQVS